MGSNLTLLPIGLSIVACAHGGKVWKIIWLKRYSYIRGIFARMRVKGVI